MQHPQAESAQRMEKDAKQSRHPSLKKTQPHYNLLVTEVYFYALGRNWTDLPCFSLQKVLAIPTCSKCSAGCWQAVESISSPVLSKPINCNFQWFYSFLKILQNEVFSFSTKGYLMKVLKIPAIGPFVYKSFFSCNISTLCLLYCFNKCWSIVICFASTPLG